MFGQIWQIAEKTSPTKFKIVRVWPEGEGMQKEIPANKDNFKNATLIYREPNYSADYDVPLCEVEDWHTRAMTNSVGQPFKVDDPGRSFTAEQVENMTLKELGLQVKGRENDAWGTVGVYIEASNPSVCLDLKHTTLKGATVIVTESFAV
jgi:hypothetical protein